ncbi:MAG: hypothetical protein D3904_09745 [Candidatus Electrothrix sp. EH2]|nr:hypothetical protein [Candidatus Electrothrix sp. EH2]
MKSQGEKESSQQKKYHQLLKKWNATQVPFPDDRCIHQLFEEQVERTPDAVALVLKGRELTYRDLNCREDQESLDRHEKYQAQVCEQEVEAQK